MSETPKFKTCLLSTYVSKGAYGYGLLREEDLNSSGHSILVPFPFYTSSCTNLDYIKNWRINKLDRVVVDKRPFTEYTQYKMEVPSIDPLYEDMPFTESLDITKQCFNKLFKKYKYSYMLQSVSRGLKGVNDLLAKSGKSKMTPRMSIARIEDVAPPEITKDGVYLRIFDSLYLYLAVVFSNKEGLLDFDGCTFNNVPTDALSLSLIAEAIMDPKSKNLASKIKKHLNK